MNKNHRHSQWQSKNWKSETKWSRRIERWSPRSVTPGSPSGRSLNQCCVRDSPLQRSLSSLWWCFKTSRKKCRRSARTKDKPAKSQEAKTTRWDLRCLSVTVGSSVSLWIPATTWTQNTTSKTTWTICLPISPLKPSLSLLKFQSRKVMTSPWINSARPPKNY